MSAICDEMSDTVNTARQYLEACGLETVTHTNEDIFLYELLSGFLRPSLKGIKQTQIPKDIRDALSPDSADMTHRDYTVTEGEYRSYLYLSAGGYPSSAGLAWAAPFAEAGGGITAVFYLERKSREQIIPKIGNAAVFNRSRIQEVGDTRSDYEQLDDAIDSALFMKSQINREGEDFYYINTLMSVSADIDADSSDTLRDNSSVLLEKIQNIHIFFDLLYPGFSPDEKYLLDTAILNCYRSFGITKDNRSLTDKNGRIKRMPCFADLIPFMEKFTELKSVTMALKRLVEGSASGLGGQTNIDLSSPFIVLDTSRLSKEFTALGTFIATEFVKDRISLSRVKKKAVILDEAWKIAGETGNEQAADFVVGLIKTVRGYGAIFVSATQNVIDYFALNGGKFGDALLGNSRLKLLLQLEETEAVKLKEKLMLTESETMQIIRCGRGEGLLCAGRNRIAIDIRASDTEFELITTDRESLEKRVNKEEL